jgi:hypothetical protein
MTNNRHLALHRQVPSLVVVENDSFLTQLLLEHVNLCPLEIDNLLLLLVAPACEDQQQKLPGL